MWVVWWSGPETKETAPHCYRTLQYYKYDNPSRITMAAQDTYHSKKSAEGVVEGFSDQKGQHGATGRLTRRYLKSSTSHEDQEQKRLSPTATLPYYYDDNPSWIMMTSQKTTRHKNPAEGGRQSTQVLPKIVLGELAPDPRGTSQYRRNSSSCSMVECEDVLERWVIYKDDATNRVKIEREMRSLWRSSSMEMN